MTGIPSNEDEEIQSVKDGFVKLVARPKKLTKREIVLRLTDQIVTAQRNGNSLREIAEYLRNCGLDISYSTLRNYLPRQLGQRARKPREHRKAIAVSSPAKTPEPAKTSDPAPRPDNTPPKPAVPSKRVFRSGATFIPIGNGEFLPAPDSDDL